jgi:hypothetical protein
MTELGIRAIGARTEPHAAVPTLLFDLALEETTGQLVESIALRCQIRIEPHRRRYSPEEQHSLLELFGETPRWGDTLKPFLWTHASTIVPRFSGSTRAELPVTCTYDFEVAASKYLHALEGGEIPTLLLFSGTVFVQGPTLGQGSVVPSSRPRLARDDGSLFPEFRLAPAADRHAGPPDAMQSAARRRELGPAGGFAPERCRGDRAMRFERARKVADAVLYEGYVLYPYRASASKNHMRWQFGVLAPPAWCEAGGCENSWSQTECLVEASTPARLMGQVRFLQLQRRAVEESIGGGAFRPVPSLDAGGRLWTTWDEGIEREAEFVADLEGERTVRFEFGSGREVEVLRGASGPAGRLVRELWPLAGEIRISSERPSARLVRIRLRLDNVTRWDKPGAPREEALRASFAGAHLLLSIEGGEFVSLLDPPEWASAAARACRNVRTWPVLIGPAPERDVLLSSPIILYDYPEVAKESPGDLYDSTEIDEILTLRTLTLTDEEKREARATDARAAAILDRVDRMSGEVLESLHGAVRSLRGPGASEGAAPWWDPGADASVSPETDSVQIKGVTVSKGSVVRMHPARHADAQDMFLDGRLAVVQGVYQDVEDRRYLAVTPKDDPAADLHEWYGRYLYFSPEEVEPAGEAP